jgi:hypothetical protein
VSWKPKINRYSLLFLHWFEAHFDSSSSCLTKSLVITRCAWIARVWIQWWRFVMNLWEFILICTDFSQWLLNHTLYCWNCYESWWILKFWNRLGFMCSSCSWKFLELVRILILERRERMRETCLLSWHFVIAFFSVTGDVAFI